MCSENTLEHTKLRDAVFFVWGMNNTSKACSPALTAPTQAQLGTVVQSIADASLPTLNYRFLVGLVVAGASAVDPQAKVFVDGSMDVPFGGNGITSRVSMWGDGRISSIAQAGSLSNFTSVSSYVSPVLSNPSQMVQSAEVNGGFELNPWRWPYRAGGLGTRKPWTVQLLLQGGFITPLSPTQVQPSFYVATTQVQNYYSAYSDQFATACKTSTGSAQTCYVGFVPTDQVSFFHSYSAGVR